MKNVSSRLRQTVSMMYGGDGQDCFWDMYTADQRVAYGPYKVLHYVRHATLHNLHNNCFLRSVRRWVK